MFFRRLDSSSAALHPATGGEKWDHPSGISQTEVGEHPERRRSAYSEKTTTVDTWPILDTLHVLSCWLVHICFPVWQNKQQKTSN
jgi:hypothetical protein